MIDWKRGMGSVCHGYMCILLYVKLLQCSGFPEIYAQLEEGAWGQCAMGICAFFYMSNFCSVVVSRDLCLIGGGGMGSVCHRYMCILLYVKLLQCSSFPEIYAWLEEGALGHSAMGICVFLYMSNFCSVVVFQRSMLDWRRGKGSVCHGYMCILLYVRLIWCSGFPEIYAWLEEGAWGQSAMGICAFFYMSNLIGVVVFQRSMVDWRRRHGVSLPWVYVHSAICATYLVYWYAIHLWSIAGGTFALSIFAFCYILNLFSVVKLHRSMANWRRGALVYVHSAICETSLV